MEYYITMKINEMYISAKLKSIKMRIKWQDTHKPYHIILVIYVFSKSHTETIFLRDTYMACKIKKKRMFLL